ncbi:MAG: hypothetical protein VYA39_05250 [Candidatus Thermoplasmatota archaeon]|nr:hypothetical protein [Candidatus Thermoplasmatota archaeon]
MVTATRLLLIAMSVASVPIYLVFIVPEGLIMQAAGAVLILLMVSMILFTGRRPIPPAKKESVFIEQQSDFGDIELPPPVHSEESLEEVRASKIRRSRGRKSSPEIPEPEVPETTPVPTSSVPLESTSISEESDDSVEGTARVHIARSDPELQAEAEVDLYLAQQRERREIFRDRLHRERRLEMSKRLADEARKWTHVEDGEDLSTLTSIPGHGLAVFYEPEEPDPSIPQGVSYVRIDDERVLKVRVSLDVPRSEPNISQEEISKSQDIGSIPPPPNSGMPMPPPTLPDIPPPIGPED